MAKWRLIADLYGVEQSDFDKAKTSFIYNYDEPEEIKISWMLIGAIIISFIIYPALFTFDLKKNHLIQWASAIMHCVYLF